jgi:tetratricopeptide (TPR) repeat protein
MSTKTKFIALFSLLIFGAQLFAQDLNTAIDIFNEGNQALQADNKELAIDKYKQALDIASKLGPEGTEIVAACKTQIPTLYYQLGVQDYRDQNTDKAIEEFQNAIKYGKDYGDSETVQKAEELIPRLYFAKGNDLFKNDSFEEALANFKLSAEIDPSYARAYWGQGLALNRMNKLDEMDEAFMQARTLAETQQDDALVDRINSTAKRFLQSEGTSKLQAQNWNDAIKYFSASNFYQDDNADTYYYLALANNGLSKWSEAVKAAEKGIALSAGESNDVKAKFYFELGNAHKGAGNNSKACEAYSNAMHGRFVDNAKYEMDVVLKCN